MHQEKFFLSLAREHDIPFVRMELKDIQRDAFSLFPQALMDAQQVFAYKADSERVFFLTCNPLALRLPVLDYISHLTNRRPVPRFGTKENVHALIEKMCISPSHVMEQNFVPLRNDKLPHKSSIQINSHDDKTKIFFEKNPEDMGPPENIVFPKTISQNINDVLEKRNGYILFIGLRKSGKRAALYQTTQYIQDRYMSSSQIYLIDFFPPKKRHQDIHHIMISNEHQRILTIDSLLKRDTDVLILPDITPREEEYAVRAAQSGRLVIASAHETHHESPHGIPFLPIEQRKIKKLCPLCRHPYKPRKTREKKSLAVDGIFYKKKGCVSCKHTGYHGHKIIFAHANSKNALARELLRAARCGIATLEETTIKS